MGKLQRIWQIMFDGDKIPFVDEAPKEDSNSIGMKDLLKFMEKQHEANAQIMQSVAQASLSQAQTMATYIELFKPRDVKSTTLEEREQARENQIKVREHEFEGITSAESFNRLMTGNEIPPDPSEW